MSYKQLHSEMWTEPFFLDLDLPTKMLFIYLFSNDRANVLGLYQISRKAIAFETGMSMDQVEDSFEILGDLGKVKTNGTWVWIPKLLARNTNNLKSELTQKHIARLVQDLPDSCPFRQEWLDYYNQNVAPRYGAEYISLPESCPQDAPSDDDEAPSVPLHSGIVGGSSNSNSINSCNPITEQKEGAASAAQPRASPTNGPHDAIEAYRSVMELYPAKTAWAGVIAAVGDDPADVERWRETCLAWTMSGWNPTNVRGILKYFQAEMMPGDDPELMVYEEGES